MDNDLLRQYIGQVLAERVGDEQQLKVARNSYLAITKFLKSIQGGPPSTFDGLFGKERGRYTSIPLSTISPRPEHENVTLIIKDRATFNIRKGLRAVSGRELTPTGPGKPVDRKYDITLFVDIDRNQNWAAYNKEFRETVADKFSAEGENWEHFVHEFTHILDAQRLSDEYLLHRNELLARRKASRAADEDAYLNAYVNDPIETNAYIRQSMARVLHLMKGAKTQAERDAILGTSPHQFVDKFFDQYLVKISKKRFSEENRKKALKRAVGFYELLRKKYDQPTAI